MAKRGRNEKGNPRQNKRRKQSKAIKNEQLQLQMMKDGKPDENCFGNSWFELGVCIVTSQSDGQIYSNSNDESIAISTKLVFENGDTASDVDLTTDPKHLEIVEDGEVRFNVKIDTLSMYHDNRRFKIVFTVNDAAKHINSVTTEPFRLVKHRLEITEEPAEMFYKDEGGRANCLNCKLCLKDSLHNTVVNRTIPLVSKLVYEDQTPAQSQRDILEIISSNLELKKGMCNVDFRINEVSKNHGKRKFCLQIECSSDDPVFNDISSCLTRAIMVYSKRTKTKPKTKKPVKQRIKKKTGKNKDNNTNSNNNNNNNNNHISNNNNNNMNNMNNIGNHTRNSRRTRGGGGMIGETDYTGDEMEDNDMALNGMNMNAMNSINSINSINPLNGMNYNMNGINGLNTMNNINNLNNINGLNSINNINSMNNDVERMHSNYSNIAHNIPNIRPSGLPTVKNGVLPKLAKEDRAHNQYNQRKQLQFHLKIKKEGSAHANGNNDNNGNNNKDNNGGGGGSGSGGVFGSMLDWCTMAEQVMKTIEWLPNGYEFDEKTNCIDYQRPLYRCCYCLRYRNATGYGAHETWCQLQAALKEYSKVKTIDSEFREQQKLQQQPHYSQHIQPNTQGSMGTMGTMQDNEDAPPQMDNNNNNNNNNNNTNGTIMSNINNNNDNTGNNDNRLPFLNNNNNNNNNANNTHNSNDSTDTNNNSNNTHNTNDTNNHNANNNNNNTNNTVNNNLNNGLGSVSFGPATSNTTNMTGFPPFALPGGNTRSIASIGSLNTFAHLNAGPQTSSNTFGNFSSFNTFGATNPQTHHTAQFMSPQQSSAGHSMLLPNIQFPAQSSGFGPQPSFNPMLQSHNRQNSINSININGVNGVNTVNNVNNVNNVGNMSNTVKKEHNNNNNGMNSGNNNGFNGINGVSGVNGVNNVNGGMNSDLPSIFPRVDSVATKAGQFGYAALDEQRNLLGFFGDDLSKFTHAEQMGMRNDQSHTFWNTGNEFVTRKDANNDVSFAQDVKRVISGGNGAGPGAGGNGMNRN